MFEKVLMGIIVSLLIASVFVQVYRVGEHHGFEQCQEQF